MHFLLSDQFNWFAEMSPFVKEAIQANMFYQNTTLKNVEDYSNV